jgi:hypothetical protein
VIGALETLSAFLHSEEDFRVQLQRVCEQVVRAVPGVDEATVTLVRGDNPETAATTKGVAVDLDHVQYRESDGPCLEAAATGKLVCVAVVDAIARWPAFGRAAVDAGMGTFLSAPLVIDELHSGAINCYSLADGGSDERRQRTDLRRGPPTAPRCGPSARRAHPTPTSRVHTAGARARDAVSGPYLSSLTAVRPRARG